ncbi:MAG: hypothetical protein Q7S12_00540 [bacterium]|nr:hypothetical protein [bacterium]
MPSQEYVDLEKRIRSVGRLLGRGLSKSEIETAKDDLVKIYIDIGNALVDGKIELADYAFLMSFATPFHLAVEFKLKP